MSDLVAEGIDFQAMHRIVELKGEIDELNDALAVKRAERAKLEEQLAEQYAMNGVSSMNCDGYTIYRQVDRYANAKTECKQDIVAWARENGLDDMIAVNAASFKAWCKEHMSENGELPAELAGKVNLFEKVSLRMRKA